MDDLTVMDGVCDAIIKQGMLLNRKPQIVNSFYSRFGRSSNIKGRSFVSSSNHFATFPLIMNTQCLVNSQMLSMKRCLPTPPPPPGPSTAAVTIVCFILQQVQTANLKRVCVTGLLNRDGL